METERSTPFPSSVWRQSSDEKTRLVHSLSTSGVPGPAGINGGNSAESLTPKSFAPALAMNDVKHEKDGIERAYTAYPPAVVNQPAPQLSSPSGSYSGPPPPYTTYHQPAAPAVSHTSQAAYNSPPESRRDSREDRSAADAQQRQALPSISEALGRLSGISPTSAPSATSYPTGAPPQSQQDPHAHTQYAHPARPRVDVYQPSPRPYSPALHRHEAYDSRAPPPHRGLSNGSSVHSPSLNHPHHYHRSSMSSSNLSPVDPPTQHGSPRLRQSYTSVPQAPYHTSAAQSPHQSSNPPLSARSAGDTFPHSQSQHQSSVYPPQPATTQPAVLRPPPQEQPYSQPQQPNLAYSFPPPQTSGLTYEQSIQQASLAQQYRHWPPNPEFEKVEEERRAAALAHPDRGTGPGSYAVTVKRHLDDFDIENNLNDLAERASRIMEFSRIHGIKAHQYPRSAIPVAELPKMEDCDRVIDEAIALRTALERLRRAVEQQNRLAEQTAAQQSQAGKHSMTGQSSFGSENGVAGHGLANSDKNSDKTDAAGGGFANGDSKKRRGRNAQPGRCHSCNRVETPEWRRGPDGARTLCNACGLHYAKLTKKLNSGKDKTTAEASPVDTT